MLQCFISKGLVINLAIAVHASHLPDRPNEAALPPHEPVYDREAHDADEDGARPIHVHGGDGEDGWEGEEEDEEEAVGEGGPVADDSPGVRHAPRAEADGVGVGVAAEGEEEDGQGVGGVEGDGGEGEEGVEGDGAADVDEGEEADDDVVEEDGAGRRFVPVGEDGQGAREWESVVPGECPDESRRAGGDAEDGHTEDQDGPAHHGGSRSGALGRLVEDLDDGEARHGAISEDGIHVDDGVEDRDDVGKTAYSIDDDGPDHCARDVNRCVICFLGHVNDGIDTSEGKGGSEEAEAEADAVV